MWPLFNFMINSLLFIVAVIIILVLGTLFMLFIGLPIADFITDRVERWRIKPWKDPCEVKAFE